MREQVDRSYEVCPECGGANTLSKVHVSCRKVVDTDTDCNDCGHEDSWQRGVYESRIEE